MSLTLCALKKFVRSHIYRKSTNPTTLIFKTFCAVASPGFVAKRGKYGKIMSWGTHDGLHGRMQQLLDD